MATLKDVSKETGLSIGTISRILNNRGYISDEAKKRVQDAMEKLDYQPNEVARALSKQTSSLIGVIVPSIKNPYFAALVSSIQEAVAAKDYQMLLFISNGNLAMEKGLLAQCKKNRVAGIILCSGQFNVLPLKNLEIPVITIERKQAEASSSIECDNEEGGRLAAEHLIAQGCKHLLQVTSIQGNEMPADDRAKGFSKTCQEHGVDNHEVPFSETIYESMDYHQFLASLFHTFPETDGIFCSNDLAAAQAIQVLAKLGKRVPSQVKVVGFDDVPLASMIQPSLTTIRQPVKEMARYAVMLLTEATKQKENQQPTRMTMGVTLIERDSTKVE